MDSNKKRNILGILIITIIFGVLSIFSALKMFDGVDREQQYQKTSYILLLEKELQIDLKSEDDFENFKLIDYEFNIIPTSYEYYIKPCFDFVVLADGVVVTNRLAKEYDNLGFSTGDKIVKIDDQKLSGKTYFEIIDLLLSKSENTTKKFTFSDGKEINYVYKKYNDKYEYNEESSTLSVYNLDEITTRLIYDIVKEHPDLTLDLSQATVNTYEGLVNFLSLFSDEDEILFKTPENVVGQKNRKISQLKIEVKENNDKGILFALTSLSRLNPNIAIDKTNLNTTNFFVSKTLRSSSHIIQIKNVLLEVIGTSNNGGTWV